jgi:aryl-alcohol dehydrogenase-like predicted oxidoreductase
LTEAEAQWLLQRVQELEENLSYQEPDSFDAGVLPAVVGHATRCGTERLAERFGRDTIGFYRTAQDLSVSSVGLGTYRGQVNNKTDDAYAQAIEAALQSGVNLIDTSLNYRRQRSERSVAVGLRRFLHTNGGRRDEIVVCTKGGYIVRDAVTLGTLGAEDVVPGGHSVAPAFLADQIDRSRQNLGLGTIDIYYIHNPEVQLQYIGIGDFMRRIRVAFDRLELAVSDGLLRYYGTATWDGYRSGTLSLRALNAIAREVAGDSHHFRFIQLPFNLAMQEADNCMGSEGSVLTQAAELGITVIASASLQRGRLSQGLFAQLSNVISGLGTDAQRAIQFTRSAPGITSALVGMREIAHVAENVAVSRIMPLSAAEYQMLRTALPQQLFADASYFPAQNPIT